MSKPKGSCKHCNGTGESLISKLPEDITRLIRKENEKHYIVKCYYCKGTGNYSGGTERVCFYAKPKQRKRKGCKKPAKFRVIMGRGYTIDLCEEHVKGFKHLGYHILELKELVEA